MKTYTTLFFDLFNTIALWDVSKIPIFNINGKTRHSTLEELRIVLSSHAPQLAFDDFQRAFDLVNSELIEERKQKQKEISSPERFFRILEKLEIRSKRTNEKLSHDLSRKHMQLLRNAAFVPIEHRNLLNELKKTFRLGVISNFDHAESAKTILTRDCVALCFEQIFISEEFGWRKPDDKIFNATCDAFGEEKENILFIGDSIEDDILGATNAGLDVAWINPKSVTLPPTTVKPTYEIKSILELKELLLR